MDGPVTKTIDGLTFTISQLPGRRAFALWHRLCKTTFPALGVLGKGLVGAGSILDLDVAAVLGSLGADTLPRLFEDLTEAELLYITDALFETVQVQSGEKVVPVKAAFDLIFQGKMPTVFKLIAACVEVNYASFFGESGVGPLLAKLKAKPKPTGSAPTSSTSGPSGASSSPG